MNPDRNSTKSTADTNFGEETLRLIANLPAPDGLEERVHSALCAVPRSGRVLGWPKKIGSHVSIRSNSMRTAAAAAIIFVIVGGGWGIYSHVQIVQNGKIVTMPARVPASGGFAGAGAIRTPQTLPGPAVMPPVKKADAQTKKQNALSTASQMGGQHAAPQAVAH